MKLRRTGSKLPHPATGQSLPFLFFSYCPRILCFALTCCMTLQLPRTGTSPQPFFSSSGNPIYPSRNILNAASSPKSSQMFPFPCHPLPPSFECLWLLIFFFLITLISLLVTSPFPTVSYNHLGDLALTTRDSLRSPTTLQL